VMSLGVEGPWTEDWFAQDLWFPSGRFWLGSKVPLVYNVFLNLLSWTARPPLHILRAIVWVKSIILNYIIHFKGNLEPQYKYAKIIRDLNYACKV